jgi:hypothetical protein
MGPGPSGPGPMGPGPNGPTIPGAIRGGASGSGGSGGSGSGGTAGVIVGGTVWIPPGTPATTPPGTPPGTPSLTCAIAGLATASATTNGNACLIVMFVNPSESLQRGALSGSLLGKRSLPLADLGRYDAHFEEQTSGLDAAPHFVQLLL